MKTNVDYWHNSHRGVGEAIRANGNVGHSHLSARIEDNTTPMEINEDVNMVGNHQMRVFQSKFLLRDNISGWESE